MTAFSGRRFSVFANQSKQIDQECDRVGHTQPDRQGKCYRCGLRVETPSQALRELAARTGGTIVTMTKTYPLACTEKDHRFNGSDSSCACGTTRRQTIREELHAQ